VQWSSLAWFFVFGLFVREPLTRSPAALVSSLDNLLSRSPTSIRAIDKCPANERSRVQRMPRANLEAQRQFSSTRRTKAWKRYPTGSCTNRPGTGRRRSRHALVLMRQHPVQERQQQRTLSFYPPFVVRLLINSTSANLVSLNDGTAASCPSLSTMLATVFYGAPDKGTAR
jgi:hypothetical protein